jgi:hypothetical protein
MVLSLSTAMVTVCPHLVIRLSMDHYIQGTSKHYPDYQLTNLGYRQSFDAGSFFRSTYVANGASKKILGMSPDTYNYTQLYAAAPDQQVNPT